MCFWLVFLQNTVLKCVSVVDCWNHAAALTNNPVNEFKSQTFVRTASAYTYRLKRVGYRDFLTPIDDNRWVATTFVWLSIGHRLADGNRCQLTNKASIVIDWSIDFPIIGFIDCSRPAYLKPAVFVFQKWGSEAHNLWTILCLLVVIRSD